MQRASLLSHLTSFVYCLLPIALRSHVCCLPSVLFCHMSALFWLHHLCSHAHHHMATAAAAAPFHSRVYCCDDVIGFGHVLRFKVWKLRFSRSNLWFQMTNRYATGPVFTSFDVRILFYFVWNLTFNIWIGCHKIWCPKTDVINSSTCGWPLALKIQHYKLFYLYLRPRDLET